MDLTDRLRAWEDQSMESTAISITKAMMISWLPLLGLNLTLAVLPTLMAMVSLMRKIVDRKRPARKNFRVVLTQTATAFRILTINAPRLQAKLNLTSAPTRMATVFLMMKITGRKLQAKLNLTAAPTRMATVFRMLTINAPRLQAKLNLTAAPTRTATEFLTTRMNALKHQVLQRTTVVRKST